MDHRKRRKLNLVSSVAIGVLGFAMRIVEERMWGEVPFAPLWVVVPLGVAFVVLADTLFPLLDQVKRIGTVRSFRGRFGVYLGMWAYALSMMLYVHLCGSLDGVVTTSSVWIIMAVAGVGSALIAAGWTRRRGEADACAKCGYERPPVQSEACEVCTECGHRWWLPGGAVKAKRDPMWRPIVIGALIVGLGVPMLWLGFRHRNFLDRAMLRLVSTDRLIQVSTSPRLGLWDDIYLDAALGRRLSPEQRARLANGLLDLIESNSMVSQRAVEWFERQLADGSLSVDLRERYLGNVSKVEFQLGRMPVDRVSSDTLFAEATQGEMNGDDALDALLKRGISDGFRVRLITAFLDHRRDVEDLSTGATSWIETGIGRGLIPADLRERYFAEMFSFWLVGAETATVGAPMRVQIASRDRSGRSSYRVWACLAGVSTNAGMTWSDPSPRWEDAVIFGNLRYLGSYRSQTLRKDAPRVVFDAPGQRQILVRLWLLATPRGSHLNRVEWNADGTPALPSEAVWSTEVTLEHPLRVEPP